MKSLIATRTLAAVFAAAMLMLGGCRQSPRTSVVGNAAQVEQDVRDMLTRWAKAFASRDLAGVESVLARSDRFVWLEDGEQRYRSVDDIVSVLSKLPPDLTFSHEITSVQVTPLSDAAAWAQIGTKTEIRHRGRAVSAFSGVVLVVTERSADGWKVVAGHTSTSRPRANN